MNWTASVSLRWQARLFNSAAVERCRRERGGATTQNLLHPS
jgi:hypothetical protein